MLQLILGTGGTGKTSLLYQRLRQRADAGQKSILLVPEQFTSSTESRIYHLLGEARSGLVESFSFTSLAERVLAVCGGAAVRTLTDAGRAMLVRRAMAELGDSVSYYSRHRRSTAFCTLAAQTIDELKSAGLSPAALTALAPRCGAEQEKLAALALIYGGYEALLARTAMDPSDRITLAADRLEAAVAAGRTPDFLAGCSLFVDEFDTFNAPKKRLMAALLAIAPEVTVALTADGDAAGPQDMDLFSGGRKVAAALKQLARRAGVPVAVPIRLTADRRHADAPGLAALTRFLADEDPGPEGWPAAPAEVRLFAAASREEEARAAAAAIRRLVRGGVRYRQIALVCRDPEQYRAAVRYECRLAEIPLFCDEATTPAFCAPAAAVRALLQILRGDHYGENMVALAKTGLCGLTERQVCALDNYVYTWAPGRAAWNAPFERSPEGFGETSRLTEEQREDVRQAEAARQKLTGPVETLRKKAKGAGAAALSKALYLCLKALGAEACQQAQVEALRRLQGIPAAEEAAREWNVVMDLLDQMAGLAGEEVLPAAEYAELFALLLRTSDLGHIPQSLDAVIFTAAGKMRLDEPDYVFVLGLAEGEFPAAPGDTGLLTHADRDALMAQDVELPDCFENRVVREQICFYKALTAPRKGLWLSWPAGLGLPLSSALAGAAGAFGFAAPGPEETDYAATPAAALDRLGSVWTAGGTEAASLYAALTETDQAAPVMTALRRTAENAPQAVTDLAAMHQVLGDALHLSASQIEQFYSCRYGYFLRYVLGLRPRRQARLTPDQSGNLMHWALQMALDPDPASPGAAWRPGPFVTLDDTQLAVLARRLTAEYAARYLPDDSARMAYLLRRVSRSLAGLFCYIRDEQSQSGFHPVACEARISPETGCLPPQTYRLAGGERVQVVGSIDRVDQWVDETGQPWVRVVDYKTGTRSFDLREVYCGLDCQMLLYLFTLTRDTSGRFTGARPAGVLYLLADPAPRPAARQDAPGAVYQLDGLVADAPPVYDAMDAAETGLYLPFSFRGGRPSPYQKNKLADPAKFARIQTHLDGIVEDMARALYAGQIAADPLCEGSRDSCAWCDYAAVCCHEKGVGERTLQAPEHPFEAEPEEAAEPAKAAPAGSGPANPVGTPDAAGPAAPAPAEKPHRAKPAAADPAENADGKEA